MVGQVKEDSQDEEGLRESQIASVTRVQIKVIFGQVKEDAREEEWLTEY